MSDQNNKFLQAQRERALTRPELREPSVPRRSATGPTSMAIKLKDPVMVAMIDAASKGKLIQKTVAVRRDDDGVTAGSEWPAIPGGAKTIGLTAGSDPAGGVPSNPTSNPESYPGGGTKVEIDGYVVVDGQLGTIEGSIAKTFAATPEDAVEKFFAIDVSDVEERELGAMSGRYHVRHARLTIMGKHDWEK